MILEELAGIEGLDVRENEPLGPRTTLRTGGPARFFCEATSKQGLSRLLHVASLSETPVLFLGKGSNVLIPDEGIAGIVAVLGGDFLSVHIEGETVLAGAGASLMSLAIQTKNAGLSGLESLSGIPSTVGGAIRINAGAYGSEIFDLLTEIELISPSGGFFTVEASKIGHSYRWSALMDRDERVVGGLMKLKRRPKEEIEERFQLVSEKRRNALPKEPNAGSIFKNPAGANAGRLIEQCGLKGTRIGGAEISEKHANVIINRGGARASDVRALMIRMRDAVHAHFGIELVPEIELLSGPLGPTEAGGSSVQSTR